MHETMVSIMPLVENRDAWKRRALIAEAQLPDVHTEPKTLPKVESISTRYNYAPLDGSRVHEQVLKEAMFALGRALLEARCVQARIVDGNLKLFVFAVPGNGPHEMDLLKLVDTLIKG